MFRKSRTSSTRKFSKAKSYLQAPQLIEALELRRLLSAVMFYPTNSDGVYTPDLMTRVLANGTQASSYGATTLNDNATTTTYLADTYGGGTATSTTHYYDWLVQATPNDPNVVMSQVLNLVASSGDSVTSFAVSQVAFNSSIASNLMATDWKVEGSTNGTTWTDLFPWQATNANSRSTFAGTVQATFAPQNVGYVRIDLMGAPSSGQMVMYNPRVYASAGGPAISNNLGFDVGDYQQDSLTTSTPANWATFHDITNATVGAANLAGSATATGNAQAIIDYGEIQPISQFSMLFANGTVWQYGGKVEVSADDSTWTTVLDQPAPLGNTGSTPVEITPVGGPINVRYVRITDYYSSGNGIGTGALTGFEAFSGSTNTLPAPLKTFTMATTGSVSAGVYDTSGNMVDDVMQASPFNAGQTVDVYWDGRTQLGPVEPTNQQYEVRVLTDQASAVNDNYIADSSTTPFNMQNAPEGTDSVAADSSGNVYLGSGGEEDALNLRKVNSSGVVQWQTSGVAMGLATDGTYVYAGGNSSNRALYRYSASTGAAANYTGLGVNYVAYTNTTQPALDIQVDAGGIFSGDDGRVWIVTNGTIQVNDKSTGAVMAASIPTLTTPQGIAIQNQPSGSGISPTTLGVLWISSAGGSVTKYTWTVNTSGVPTLTATSTTISLNDPYNLSFGGPNNYLYVTEIGADTNGHGQVLWYNVSGTPTYVGSLGTLQTPGPVANSSFFWYSGGGFNYANPSIAVDPSGQIVVTDGGQQRTQWFNADGSLYYSWISAGSEPTPDVFGITPTTYEVISAEDLVYTVTDSTGAWALTADYKPTNLQYNVEGSAGDSQVVTLTTPGGAENFVVNYDLNVGVNPNGLSIFALESSGMRVTTLIASYGNSGNPSVQLSTDANGNGIFDSGETTTTTGTNFSGSQWMDSSGNIWFSSVRGDTGLANNPGLTGGVDELKLEGWTSLGGGKYNPIYNWADRLRVIQPLPDTVGFESLQVKIGPTGDIYDFGVTPTDSGYLNAFSQTLLRIANPAGTIIGNFQMPTPYIVSALGTTGNGVNPFNDIDGASIDPVPGSGIFFTDFTDNAALGYGVQVQAHSADGLLIAQGDPSIPAGYTAGWPDEWLNMSAFDENATPSASDNRYIEVESNFYDSIIRFNFSGLGTVAETYARFTWTSTGAVSGEQQVQVQAVTPTALEQGQVPGVFQFTRVGVSTSPLTVDYVVSGSAIAGTDYSENLTGSVVIPAGADYVDQTITPISNGQPYGDSNVQITLVGNGSAYTLNNAVNANLDETTANVTIVEASTVPKVSILATQPADALPGGANGVFTISRDSAPATPLTVYYQVSGAANAADYTPALTGSATIPANASSTTITITPATDASTVPSQSLILTLLPARAGYTLNTALGFKTSDTVMIQNANATIAQMAYWSFDGSGAINYNATSLNSNLTATPMSVVIGTITPENSGTNYWVANNGMSDPLQDYTFNLTVAPGEYLSLHSMSLEWSQDEAGNMTLSVDGMTDLSEPYLAATMLPPAPTPYTMTDVVLGPGTHTFDIRGNGITSGSWCAMDVLSFSGTMVADTLANVAILATTPGAAETGPTAGTYTVTRDGPTTSALVVNYAISGTATNTTDYSTLSGSVTIPSGSSSAAITLTPVDDSLLEGTENAILTLTAGDAYAIVPGSNLAQINIADDLAKPAPSALSATAISSSQINLSWTNNCGNPTGFEIDRATNSTFTTGLTTFTVANPSATSYSDTTVSASTTYYYRVRAYAMVNGVEVDSNNSSSANATTSSSGSTFLYDGFNDATGTLTGDSGGMGWTSGVNWGTGTGPGTAGTVVSGNLAFPDGTSGTGNMVGSTTGGLNSTRLLPSTMAVNYNAAGTYYFSFLVQKNSANGGSNNWLKAGLQIGSGNGSNDETIGGIASNGSFQLEATNTLGNIDAGSATVGTDYFIVVKLVTRATGLDDFYLQAYAPTNLFTTEPTTWTLSETSINMSAVANPDRFVIEGGTAVSGNIDEVRMGTSYASILPPTLYDGFNDATGTLTGDGGGTGWTTGVNWGTGTGPGSAATVYNGTLVYPDGTPGTGNMAGGTTGGFNSTRLLPSNLAVNYNSAGTYYFSFLVQKNSATSTSNDWLKAGLQVGSGNGSNDTTIGGIASNGTFQLEAANTLGSINAGPATMGTSYFIVVKFVTRATGLDDFYLEAYAPTSSFTTEPTTWTLSETSINMSAVANPDRFVIEGGTIVSGNINEVRMGTTYASILPPIALYDGFNDATGTLTGDGGGTGWPSGVNWGTGTGPGGAGTVVSGNLVFPDGTAGTGNMVGSTTGGFNSTRLLPSTMPVNYNAAGTYYFSFLVQKNSANSGSNNWLKAGLQVGSGNGSNDETIGGIASNGNFQLEATNTLGNIDAGTATVGTDYFIVVKFVTRATGLDDFYLQAYAPTNSFTTEPTTWTLSETSINMSAVANPDRFVIEGGTAVSGNIDEVRMGTTYASILPAVNYPSSLAAYWRLDEKTGSSAFDSVTDGASDTAALNNSPTWVAGHIGNALQFNGTNQYISVPNSTAISPTSAITLSTWAKSSSSTTWNAANTFFYKSSAYSLGPLNSSSKTIQFQVYIGGAWESVSYTPTFDISQWHLYTASYDGNNLRLYVDGVIQNTVAQTGAITTSTNALTMGQGSGVYLSGSLDEMRLYNAALSPTGIQALYNQPALSVTGLSVSSSHSSSYSVQSNALATGIDQYGDASTTFNTIPGQYDGSTLIRTASADSLTTGNSLMSFTVNTTVAVYVLYDASVSSVPSWLTNGFINTGDSVTSSAGATFHVYKQIVTAGTITLGGNTVSGSGSPQMYSVLLAPVM